MDEIFRDFSPKFAIAVSAAVFFFAAVIFWQIGKLPDGKFHLKIFEVFAGDAILLETVAGHSIVVDGGENSDFAQKLFAEKNFFDRKIDAVILTHPHADHLLGAAEVLEKFAVEKIILTGAEGDAVGWEFFAEKLRKTAAEIIFVNSKNAIVAGDLKLEILNPQENLVGQTPSNLNDSSIVLRGCRFGKCFLLAADAEKNAEESMIRAGFDLSAEVLKVGHQGSKTSSTENFLRTVRPNFAVIPAGRGNSFGHPHAEVVDRLKKSGAEIFITRENGTAEFIFDRGNFAFSTQR